MLDSDAKNKIKKNYKKRKEIANKSTQNRHFKNLLFMHKNSS